MNQVLEIVNNLLTNLDVVSILTGVLLAVLAALGGEVLGLVKKTETKIDDKLAIAVVEKLVADGLVKEKVLADVKKQLETETNAGA